jgi:hypothetical protein
MKPSEKQIDKVDQLFKNKLSDHTLVPSEDAWTRVEASLAKKNKPWFVNARPTVIQWRWAAAILLMGALTVAIYLSQRGGVPEQKLLAKKVPTAIQSNSKSTEAQKLPLASDRKKIKQEPNVQRYKPRDIRNNEAPVQQNDLQSTKENESSGAKQKIMETEAALAQQYTIKLTPTETSTATPHEEKNKSEATTNTTVASSTQKPIKLEFTLDALPSEETVATTTEAKKTGIKKVLNLAREMKQGEGPVTNLRDKKDELLAHNFLNRKERNQ